MALEYDPTFVGPVRGTTQQTGRGLGDMFRKIWGPGQPGMDPSLQHAIQRQGMMGLGMNLLAQSGPQPVKPGFGEGLGKAWQATQQDLNRYTQQAMRTQILQQESEQREEARKARQQAYENELKLRDEYRQERKAAAALQAERDKTRFEREGRLFDLEMKRLEAGEGGKPADPFEAKIREAIANGDDYEAAKWRAIQRGANPFELGLTPKQVSDAAAGVEPDLDAIGAEAERASVPFEPGSNTQGPGIGARLEDLSQGVRSSLGSQREALMGIGGGAMDWMKSLIPDGQYQPPAAPHAAGPRNTGQQQAIRGGQPTLQEYVTYMQKMGVDPDEAQASYIRTWGAPR